MQFFFFSALHCSPHSNAKSTQTLSISPKEKQTLTTFSLQKPDKSTSQTRPFPPPAHPPHTIIHLKNLQQNLYPESVIVGRKGNSNMLCIFFFFFLTLLQTRLSLNPARPACLPDQPASFSVRSLQRWAGRPTGQPGRLAKLDFFQQQRRRQQLDKVFFLSLLKSSSCSSNVLLFSTLSNLS